MPQSANAADTDIGYGTTVTWDSVTYYLADTAEVGGVVTDTVDVTNSQSAGGYREFIAGLSEQDNITLIINAGGAGQMELRDKDIGELDINFPDGSSYTTDAIIIGTPLSVPIGDRQTIQVTWKPTGAPTIGAAS